MEKGKPPLSERTKRSGGERPPEQRALRFDSADLSFVVLPDARRLEGHATLQFTAEAPVSRIILDLDSNLVVRSVGFNRAPLSPDRIERPDGQVIVNRSLRAGERATVDIFYDGTPHVAVRAPWDDGMVWSKTPDGRSWFATTAQGYGCDLFWPCLDFPTGEPAIATLHITVPKGLKAPSNGRLLGVDTLPDGRTSWHWRVKRPNTYGIALNVGPYEEISGTYKSRFSNVIPMFYWHLPGERAKAEALFAEFAPTLDFFEEMIGPYPFADEKLGVVETPHLGMEHQTINAYGNNYAKAIEGFDWLFQHEFAHEWFANQLTARDWDDFWLHEGFGTYMQPLYGEWREGDARYAAMMQTQRASIANKAPIVSGRSRTAEQVYEAEQGGPGQDIYYKASWMLHTLRHLIGDKAFFDATRLSVYGRVDPKPGNFAPRFGTTPEFEANVAAVTGQDYRWFFDVYLRQAALPELVEQRRGDTLALEWKAPGGGAFPLPVEVRVGAQRHTVAMTGGRGTLAIPAGAHVVVDPHARLLKRSRAVEEMQAARAKP